MLEENCKVTMKIRNILTQQRPPGSVAFLLVSLFASAAFGQVAVTNLPTLGGTVFSATALNNAGQVAGLSGTADDAAQHAFLFSQGITYDLGTLGGASSTALGLNASGQVVGDSFTADEQHAFLASAGKLYDLGTLGGSHSSAVAVNDSGQVTGYSYLQNSSWPHAFLWSGGPLLDLGTLGGSLSSAVALNRFGQVTGSSFTTNNAAQHAFLYSGGVMYDLGGLGVGAYSSANAINDAGQVVGESDTNVFTHAFLYSNGSMLDLGTLGGTYSSAYAINNSGQVIGDSSTLHDAQYHGFIYQNGKMTDLGTLGGLSSSAAAINNLGQVVGNSEDASQNGLPFLWQNGVMVDLNSLLPANSGWVLASAKFINDSGQIVGAGSYNGESAWYLLSTKAPNRPPVADAGPDQTVECPAAVLLDGRRSSDPDGDAITSVWTEGSTVLGSGPTLQLQLALGSHSITLTVTDSHQASAQTTITVKVVDSTPPVVVCTALKPIPANAHCLAAVPDLTGVVQVQDNCTPASQLVRTQSPASGTLLGPGVHPITVTVADLSGNSASCTANLTILDSSPPVIRSIAAHPSIIKPDDHEMVPVRVWVKTSDSCGPAPVARILSITSSDPVKGRNDKTSPDWRITGPLTAKVRAELTPKERERVYTITVQCTDASGNSSTKTTTVTVSKRQCGRD